MITGIIKFQNNTLVVEFPCSSYDLSAHLGSIGIKTPATEIRLDKDGEIEVSTYADNDIGGIILGQLSEQDTLSSLNLSCQEINKACPFGYGEFMDMLDPKQGKVYENVWDRYKYYEQYQTRMPSTAVGAKYLLEEVLRYKSTMENFRCACESEECADEDLIRAVSQLFLPNEDGNQWER